MHLANRDDFTCPACGTGFERLLVSEERTETFSAPGEPFCVARTEDQLPLLTH